MRTVYVAVAAGLATMATPSLAAPLTETYSFAVGSFACMPTSQNTNCPATPGPASGSFTVTFDPTQNYANDTADITVKSLTGVTVGSTLGFTYNPIPVNSAGAKLLTFGGLQNGAVTAGTGTDDLAIVLDVSSPTAPVLFDCGNYQFCGSVSGNGNYLVSNETEAGAVSFNFRALAAGSSVTASANPVTGGDTSVPEPGTLACLAGAIAGLGAILRRRPRVAMSA